MSARTPNGHAGSVGSARRRQRPSVGKDADQYDDTPDRPVTKRRRMPSSSADGLTSANYEDTGDDTFHSARNGADEDEDENEAEAPERDGGSKPTFQPGAIVRVLLENFVTYERAEFSPGPSLNMVIGPNGTGKSSLVCAICLGLGFHCNVLGRAATFADFVKHGRPHAVVEIELQKGPRDRRNFIVRLRINREDNSRKFWLNGRETPLRSIQALMQNLRIQVDNLCQFLPQDRVAEFAGLSPVELLAKTLEAAAPVEMKEWQGTLKKIYRDQREAKHQMHVDAEQLRILESRHQAQQADVERYREREAIQQTVDDLEDCRPMVRFYEAQNKYRALKAQKKVAMKELKALQERAGPTLEAVNDKLAYQRQLQQAVAGREQAVNDIAAAAQRALGGIGRVEEQLSDTINQRATLSTALENKKKEISAIRSKINQLEARLRNKPQEFVAADWNMQIREKEHLRREAEAERREIISEQEQLKIRANKINFEKDKAVRDIKALESRRGQQVSLLRRISPDAARGLEWLEQNKDRFSMEIFGPPMVTCAVKDKQYSNLVQSMLQNDDFLCFTAQNIQDHTKLSDVFYQEMGLSVTIRTCTTPFGQFRPALSPEELTSLGLDGFAIDYLEGPEPVLAMLCTERRLHASPVGLERPRQDQYDRLINSDKISTWASKDQGYRVNRRREYGAHAVSTMVRDIRPGRYWTEEQADMSEKTELTRKLTELTGELGVIQKQYQELKTKAAIPAEKAADLDGEIARLRNEKNQLQTEYSKWSALPEKIQIEKNSLTRITEEHAALRDQRLAIFVRLDELTLQKSRAILRYTSKVAKLREAVRRVVDVQVRVLEAESDYEGLREKHAELANLLVEKQDDLQRIRDEMDVLRGEGEEASAAMKAASGTAEREEMLRELAQDKTMEDLNNEVAAERAKLELTRVVDASVVEAYRKRGREIEQLRAAMATHEQGQADMSAQIAEVRGKWEPRLDELVGRINDAFSYNFEQINCAGEVSVHRDADFDKWAIDIRVKFRESEDLQKLDQHRQSGGERAVSTIFYLMSLQGMAQAPFRVVDEINQGMDPRNERMMHERMVDVACHEHASQYFLITPKLLPGLRYDENMTVLCIASGQHVPSGGAKLDLRRCMQIQRQLVAAQS